MFLHKHRIPVFGPHDDPGDIEKLFDRARAFLWNCPEMSDYEIALHLVQSETPVTLEQARLAIVAAKILMKEINE